jgi:WD40 repeat protein
VWDAATGKLVRAVHAPADLAPAWTIAFTPDGKRLVGGDLTWTVWDVETGKVILRGPKTEPGGVITVAVSPDGSRFLTGGYSDMVRVWDAATGRQVQEIRAGVGYVLAAVFTADGKSVLISGGGGTASVTLPGGTSAVRLWSLEQKP